MISNGIDLVEISRIEKSIQSESFKHKVFGEDELKYLEGKKAQSYAAAFAAKEAFGKAMGFCTKVRASRISSCRAGQKHFAKARGILLR